MEKDREEYLRRFFREAATPEDEYVRVMGQLDNASSVRHMWAEGADHYERQWKKAERERDAARKALERFILAAEAEDELLSNSERIWLAYEDARALLGAPVKNYPGGYYDTHFHLYEWEEGDFCDTCEDYRADQRTPEELAQEAGGGEAAHE